MTDQIRQFFKNVRTRPLTIRLDEATEDRLRMYIDRMNRAAFVDDPMNPDDDDDLGMALNMAAEGGLEADEQTHGLTASVLGEVMSTEVMEEGRRRRRAAREQRCANCGVQYTRLDERGWCILCVKGES